MKSNLDVWAIQYYPEELLTALNNIRDGLSIIYTNASSTLKIGDQTIIGRNFDTFLYNEDSDILIMLMSGGKVTKEDMISYLENNSKRYVEVTFEEDQYIDEDNIPEILFARDLNVIEDAIKDSINKKKYNCTIYPSCRGLFELEYTSKKYGKTEIDGRNIKDIIKFKDKIIFILNDNVDYIQVLQKYDIRIRKSYITEPNLYVKNFSKKLKKTYM